MKLLSSFRILFSRVRVLENMLLSAWSFIAKDKVDGHAACQHDSTAAQLVNWSLASACARAVRGWRFPKSVHEATQGQQLPQGRFLEL